MNFKPSPQLRFVERVVMNDAAEGDFKYRQTLRILQQKWVVMNNWAEAASEWRDVPLVKE